MKAAFVLFVLLHLGQALVMNRHVKNEGESARLTFLGLVFQAPMLALACWFGVQAETFSRELFSPLYIGLGLIGGHLIFGLSLLITHRSIDDASGHFFDFVPLWRFCVEAPYVLSRFIGVAISEEVIWRVALQPILMDWTGDAAVALLFVALGFSVVHHHFFKNSFVVSVEFLGFALLLGFLYYWTGSLILVIVIHAVRDIEIAYLEYLFRVHELGDEAKAEEELRAQYLSRRPERT